MNSAIQKHTALATLTTQRTSFVEVCVVHSRGSNPAPIGAQALVTAKGLFWGTVGGGKIENHVIEFSKSLLASPTNETVILKTWNLQKDIGMSCGGEMTLSFRVERLALNGVLIFGAGHVSQESARLLNWLGFHVTVTDTRKEWIHRFQDVPQIATLESLPQLTDSFLESFSYALVMTQGHATDLPILNEILKSKYRFKYLGVIGSRAKKSKLLLELKKLGHPEEVEQMFHCPIGHKIGQSVPREIALSLAAAIVECRDQNAKSLSSSDLSEFSESPEESKLSKQIPSDLLI